MLKGTTLTKQKLLTGLTVAVVILSSATVVAQRHRRPESAPLTEEEKQDAVRALDGLIEEAKSEKTIAAAQVDRALATLSRAGRAMPPETLLPRLAALRQHRTDAAIPSPGKPLRRDKSLDRQILSMEVVALKNVPPDQVPVHPCAEAFPGSVPPDAVPVSRRVEIVTDRPGWHNTGIYADPDSPYWHSTGLYAAPGQLVTVTVPDSVTGHGLHVRIGCHSDRLWRHDSWRRPPEICARFPVSSVQTEAANAFGGLIYIETPVDLTVPAFEVTIDGAVEAPHYIHGKTDLARWRESIRHLPAPWAELQTEKVIFTLPSKTVRDLDNPGELMDFWDGIMDRYAELLGRPPQRRRIERFVSDVQISAGYMHSGYPLMTMLDITGTMVDKQRIRTNGHHGVWGLFHEIGHNHQHRDWTFNGTTEVTVNLFSLYVMEKVCGLPIGGHGAVTEQARQRKMDKYFTGGCDFQQWKSDPFLALAMYVQLQQEFGWEPFTKAFAAYRALPAHERPTTDDQKRDQWMTRFSKIVGRDLGPFFQAWGIPTSEQARAAIADLPDWMPEDMPKTP